MNSPGDSLTDKPNPHFRYQILPFVGAKNQHSIAFLMFKAPDRIDHTHTTRIHSIGPERRGSKTTLNRVY